MNVLSNSDSRLSAKIRGILMQYRSKQSWFALDVEAEAASREAVEYALMEAGALGTETDAEANSSFKVVAYFDQLPDRERVRAELGEALRIYELPTSSVRAMEVREVVDEDWLGEWKKGWQPVEVGERFIVAPPWSEIPENQERLIIRIEPGMAFGTGTHETTRLCLTAIEEYFRGGSFLDVGTGTGILAIAAAKLFPGASIEACDTDAEAIAIAQENARLNGVDQSIRFRVGSIEETTASADLVCANLTADVIVELLPSLLSVSCGHLILSGILEAQVEDVRLGLQDAGVSSLTEVMQDGEWVALVV